MKILGTRTGNSEANFTNRMQEMEERISGTKDTIEEVDTLVRENVKSKNVLVVVQWWHTPLIPALGRPRQADLCEFEASLVYRVSSRTARDTQRNPVSKNQNKETKKNKTALSHMQSLEWM